MHGPRGLITVLICALLIPGMACSESNSSHLNKERLKVGRALLEVTSQNVGEIIPYEAKGMSIMKFRNRSTRVYYQRDYYSEGDIMASIPGLDQAIAGFRYFYRCAVDPNAECPPPPPQQ